MPKKTTGNGAVAKLKDFGKNIGTKAKAAGTAAKAHVSRNRAASKIMWQNKSTGQITEKRMLSG